MPESFAQNERKEDYVQSFDQLATLGSVEFGAGQKVSFQPWGRYEEERQVGTVRLWEEAPDVINISFMFRERFNLSFKNYAL